MSDAKFNVAGVVYDFPTQIRLGDAVLVKDLTGLDLDQLADAPPLLSVTAYLAISVWQANPKWTRAQAIRFIEQIDIEGLETIAGEPDPPAQGTAAETPSPSTSSASITDPAGSLEMDVAAPV